VKKCWIYEFENVVNDYSYNGDVTKYTYDLRGNRKTSESKATALKLENTDYSYDVRNRLTSVSSGAISTSISYRSDGLRYMKSSTSETVQYHYNLSGKVIAESSTSGSITSNYIWGPDRTLVKKDSTGGEYYYLYNGHGDVIQLVDRNGNVVNNYSYDEWGNILNKNETISNPFKYAGEIFDSSTGLYYLQSRYYDPAIGRFINEDSLEGTVTNPLTLNVYSYVNNNPLMYVDPTGNMAWSQLKTLLGGLVDGLTGFSDLKNLFSWDTIVGIIQFGNALISGQVSITDIAKSVGASFIEPFQYLYEHSKNVWAGKPSDQEVYEYGRSMGSATNTLAGALLGRGAAGAKIVQVIGKVCPKLLKVVDKVADTAKTIGHRLITDNGGYITISKKTPNDELIPPTKKGNAPISKKDRYSIEIHN
jgi:RHS repeat-associated protein